MIKLINPRRANHAALMSPRGMTLVEIMIVVTIMASVMGVVGFFVFGALDRANAKTAQIEIAQLEALVNSYYLTSTPSSLPDTLDDLTKGPAPLTKDVPTDPWGQDYVYRRVNNREFSIYSVGADGVDGSDDDIRADSN